jgi:predicted acyltransferase
MQPRLLSIDQYRGYAVLGMIVVNFLGLFALMPWHFKHHPDAMSYADTIAPLFIFVVGMGFRLSLQGRVEREGWRKAHLSAARRYVTLIMIGVIIYGPWQWRYWWDALVDIGFAGLLALPFMLQPAPLRAAVAIGYLCVYQVLFIWTGYGDWTMAHSIDGGPLGPLSWAMILLFGTIAYDLLATQSGHAMSLSFTALGVLLCAAGLVMHTEWPGLKTEWDFSQKAMTMPYPLFATGLCFLMYLPFYYLCEVRRIELPHLAALGMNALAIYCLHQVMLVLYRSLLLDHHAPAWKALLHFAVFYGICYGAAWWMRRRNFTLKI